MLAVGIDRIKACCVNICCLATFPDTTYIVYQTRKTVFDQIPNNEKKIANTTSNRVNFEVSGNVSKHDPSCLMCYITDFSILKMEKTETLPHQKWSADKGEGNCCTQVHAIGEMTKFFISDLSDLGYEGFFPGIKFKHLEIPMKYFHY